MLVNEASMVRATIANPLANCRSILRLFSDAVICWYPLALTRQIFPLAGRELGINVTTNANWVFAASVVQGSELVLHEPVGAVMFYFFAACCLLGLLLVFFLTPETRQVSLEEMERRLRDGVRLKQIGA